MYRQEDFDSIKKQFTRITTLMFAGLIFFIISSIVIANRVENWVGMIFLLVGICVEIFVWGVFAAPIFSYYRFIRDLVTGRTREIEGLVKGLSTDPVYKDNKLYFYEINIEEDGIERVLLLDDQKEWPQIHINSLYRFEIHENFITDFTPVTEY
ncbi:MAG: hypothetical protein GX340_08260 [Clostridiales bacterium]|jgi:hypothetical protein|nr:hypothetical protein [Clostridiales bacterium]